MLRKGNLEKQFNYFKGEKNNIKFKPRRNKSSEKIDIFLISLDK
jgi:hypothetical protein